MATKAKKSPRKRQTPSKKAESSPPSRAEKQSAAKKPATSRSGSKSKAKTGSKEAASKAKAKKGDSEPPQGEGRRLGIRGAAPWAARHAAKHAAEAKARAAEPPPPGSARATLRVPTGAEEIKARVIELHNILVEIKTLRKNLGRNFYAIGRLLRQVRDNKLYEARGFGSFEAFLDREVEIGKTTSLRLARVVEVFQQEAAMSYGMDRVLQALATLEAGHRHASGMQPAVGAPPLPLRPPVPKK